MPEETTRGAEAEPALRSLADKVNWLIDTARPAGRSPCGLLHEQVELLALVRNARVSSAQLRVILGWSTEIRQAVIHLISTLTAQDQAHRRSAQGEALAQQQTPDKGAVTHLLLACLSGHGSMINGNALS
jgi:hypothetical protein